MTSSKALDVSPTDISDIDDIKAYLVNLDYKIKVRINDATEILELRVKNLSEESQKQVSKPFQEFKKETNSRLLKNEEYIGLLH